MADGDKVLINLATGLEDPERAAIGMASLIPATLDLGHAGIESGQGSTRPRNTASCVGEGRVDSTPTLTISLPCSARRAGRPPHRPRLPRGPAYPTPGVPCHSLRSGDQISVSSLGVASHI